MTPAVGGERLVPEPDPIARDYILLALRLDQRAPGLVDGYFGPANLKAQVDMESLAQPARLADDAARLRERVVATDDSARRRWLDVQLVALQTQARVLAGDAIEYLDLVERLFDHRPGRRPDSTFREIGRELDALVPGTGPLDARLADWDAGLTVPPDRLPDLSQWLVDQFRATASSTFGLPDGEGLRLGFVRNQPWSGYNWFDGGRRSRVDLNLDLPVRAPDLIDVLAHETYPGHHLEHTWKEARLVDELGRLESSVLLINTPECLISEGLADLGHRFAVPGDSEAVILAELLERAGLHDAPDPVVAVRSAALRRGLGAIAVNAALMRHADGLGHDDVLAYLIDVGLMSPERAAKRLSFIEHPLWRTYVFVYSEGEALLGRWLDGVPEGSRAERFGRLLREAPTPSAIAAEAAAPTA
jgi:hypothetical protein